MVAETTQRWTSVPAGWAGHRLYDWGKKGLRSTQNVWVRTPGQGRKRKRFDYHHGSPELVEIVCGGDRRLLYRIRKLAPAEVWPVYERAGMYWARRYYIVPRGAVIEARAELGLAG